MQYRMVVYEDVHELRNYIKNILQTPKDQFDVVGDFPDCSDVENQVRSLKPDIVLMDIQMPHVNGLQGLNIIKKNFPKVKVLMLTDFTDDSNILKAIQLGCNGYMLKEELPFGLDKALKLLIDGEAHLTPSVAKKLMLLMAKPDYRRADYKLTDKQQEVLSLLAKAYSYKEIANELNISIDTVGSHVKDIYGKLNVHSKAAAVRKAIEEGLVNLD